MRCVFLPILESIYWKLKEPRREPLVSDTTSNFILEGKMEDFKLREYHKKVFKNCMEHRKNTNRNMGKNWKKKC